MEENIWELIEKSINEFDDTTITKLKYTLANEIIALVNQVMPWIIQDLSRYVKYKEILNKIKQYLDANMDVLKECTKQYFNDDAIEFYNKRGGIQIGLVCVTKNKKYYVKTHQYGATRTNSNSIKLPDAKELFVYVLLELLNLGPVVHFYWPRNLSKKSLYIATEEILSVKNY